jgi:hypothetical protein
MGMGMGREKVDDAGSPHCGVLDMMMRYSLSMDIAMPVL